MMKKLAGWASLILVALTLPVSNGYAQEKGKIYGSVFDTELGETLLGANVVITGTTRGAATDLDGRYALNNLEPGIYSITASYISYLPTTITGIEVKAGEAVKVDIFLEAESVGLEEIVVTATAAKNTEGALLAKRAKAIAFSDAISSEFISLSGSGDAGAAMKKVTGASVVGGKYIYIRGLGDRYSSTHMNGVELPSTDPDKKAFHLDLVPSNLLDNITTLKTFTPDKPGNFSGGIVDIATKAFPEKFLLKFSISTGYNSQVHFNPNYLNETPTNTDWRAVDNGRRSIPDIFNDPDLVIPVEVQARFNSEQAAILNDVSTAFNPRMAVPNRQVPTDHSFSFAIGNQFELFGKPLGYIASLTYGRSYTFYDNGVTGRRNVASLEDEEMIVNQEYSDAQGTDEVNWGGLVNIQYKLTPTNKIMFNVFHTQSGIQTGRFQSGIWPEQLGFPLENVYQDRRNVVNGYTQRLLTSGQVAGEHLLENLGKIQIEWKAAYANTGQEEPDLRFTSYYGSQLFAGGDTNWVIQTAGFNNPSRIFRDLEESNVNGALDVTVPINIWNERTMKFKVGAAAAVTDRQFRERWFFVFPKNNIFNQLNGDISQFFEPQYMGVIDSTTSGSLTRYTFGNFVTDNTRAENQYDGNQDIFGYYAMIDFPVFDKLRIITGARYEDATITVANADTNDVASELVNGDWLPSFNIVYNVTESMNIRAAATRTLARPNMREIATFSSFEFIGDFQKVGNPNLKRTLITNYDFRWEWFPRPGEVVAISAFHKDMENPIELGFAPGGIASNLILQFQNVPEAKINGLEIEFRKRMDFIAKKLEYLSLGANLSLVDSQISIPENDRLQRPDTTITTRDLQGQSPYILNLDLSYNNPETGLNAGVYFNVFGSRLSNVGFGTTPDVYERPRPQLDFVSSKTVHEKISVSFSVKNILNPDYLWAYEFRGNDFDFQRFQRGVSWSFGLSYNF